MPQRRIYTLGGPGAPQRVNPSLRASGRGPPLLGPKSCNFTKDNDTFSEGPGQQSEVQLWEGNAEEGKAEWEGKADWAKQSRQGLQNWTSDGCQGPSEKMEFSVVNLQLLDPSKEGPLPEAQNSY